MFQVLVEFVVNLDEIVIVEIEFGKSPKKWYPERSKYPMDLRSSEMKGVSMFSLNKR